MARDRTKIVKVGISDLIVGTVEKTGAGESYDLTTNGFPLYHLGLLADESATIKTTKVGMKEIGGHEVQVAHDVEVAASGLQFEAEEIAELENVIKATNQSVFLIGDQESHELGRTAIEIVPDLILDAKGKRLCTIQARSYIDQAGVVNTSRLAIGLDTSIETREPYRYRTFINARTRRDNLQLCLLPDVGAFGDVAKLLDESRNRYVGTLYNTPTWTYPYLRFDGVSEYADFGDILDDDGTADFAFEVWIRFMEADGVNKTVLSKKQDTTNSAGFLVGRNSGNIPYFRISDGAASAERTSSAGFLWTQNVWRHVAVAVDRNGDATIYVNGVSGGSVSVAAIGSGSNALSLYLGRRDTTYAQVDIGRVRVYNYGAGGLPASIATIIANHYNAEKSVYGL